VQLRLGLLHEQEQQLHLTAVCPSLPHPFSAPAVNPNVEIKEVPARTLVALSWHGNSPREAEVERRTAQLQQLMAQAGLKPKQGGKTHVWQYDPPFQWGMLRTNEVLIEVDGDAAQS
jgi:hypothetical protein